MVVYHVKAQAHSLLPPLWWQSPTPVVLPVCRNQQHSSILQRWQHQVHTTVQLILTHPFNRRLAQGSLPQSVMDAYLTQDRFYLRAYAAAMIALAQSMKNIGASADTVALFNRHAQHSLAMEQRMEGQYLSSGAPTNFVIGPSMLAYADHLRQATQQSPVVLLAALYPCFYLFSLLGEHASAAAYFPSHPYAAWVATYTDPEFQRASCEMGKLLEELLLRADFVARQRAFIAFSISVQHELLGFDAAYLGVA